MARARTRTFQCGQARVGKRHRQKNGPRAFERVGSEKFRESYVVADRKADAAPRRIGRGQTVARRHVLFFVKQREEMSFSVNARPLAFRVEQDRRVGDLALFVEREHRAVDPDAVTLCQAGDAVDDLLVLARHPLIVRPVEAGRPHLGEADQVAAALRRLGDQGFSFAEIFLGLRLSDLDLCDGHLEIHAVSGLFLA